MGGRQHLFVELGIADDSPIRAVDVDLEDAVLLGTQLTPDVVEKARAHRGYRGSGLWAPGGPFPVRWESDARDGLVLALRRYFAS